MNMTGRELTMSKLQYHGHTRLWEDTDCNPSKDNFMFIDGFWDRGSLIIWNQQ